VKKAVVLLSGGLDSSTALYWAQFKGYRCEALFLDYGQRHDREIKSAKQLAKAAGAHLTPLKLKLPWLGKSSLANSSLKLPDMPLSQIGKGKIPTTYVPGRNTIFLSLAVSFADAVQAEAIVIGANALDYSGYPDCRPNYLGAFAKAARLGTRQGDEGRPLKILAPLLSLDKAQIVGLALRLGVPLEKTWSCYAGKARPCGHCDSCKLRAHGFAQAGIDDPALSIS
jgi:7-cyano-7-deazaguanine synthase